MQNHIRTALESLKARFDIEAVYVFGSYSRGDASADSDLDLLAVFSELNDDPFHMASRLRVYLHQSLDIALDVVVTTREQFNQRQARSWTIEHVAGTEGIVV